MLIVLDGFCLSDALYLDTDGVLKTLLHHCEDKIVYTNDIEQTYTEVTAYSSLRPTLVMLQERKPQKAQRRRPKPVQRVIGLRDQHDAFIKDSVGLDADFFITRNLSWLSPRIRLPKGCKLQIVAPTEYVARKKVAS